MSGLTFVSHPRPLYSHVITVRGHTFITWLTNCNLDKKTKSYPGSQRFSKGRSTKCDKQSAKRWRERIEKRWENLWLPATVDWSYRANRFELGSRSDPASWLEEPYRCVVIGCLLIDLVMLIDTYRSMIVRFASPATRGLLSPLSLSSLFAAKENLWDQGTKTSIKNVFRTGVWLG